MRAIIAAALLLVGWLMSPASAQNLSKSEATTGAVTPADMQRMLEAAAGRTKENQQRFVQIDFVWPLNEAEYRETNKHNLVLIVAFSRTAGELPLRRCYIRGQGKELPLRKLSSRQSTVDAGSITRKLGVYREDGFYVAPSGAMAREGLVLCDYTTNRTEFKVYQLPGTPPDFVRNDPNSDAGPDPSMETIRKIIAREYTGFPFPN